MGPAIVIEKISNFVYRVQTVQKGSQKCLNIDKLIFFFTGNSNQSWIEATQENLNSDFDLSSIPN